MKNLLLLAGLCCALSGISQTIYPDRVCTSPAALRELSGIAMIEPNLLAAINDGGNSPTVYFMDTTGTLLKKRTFTSIINTDWEELFYRNKILYIADVGDNLCRRKTLTVFKYDLEKDTIVAKINFGFEEKGKGILPEKDRHYDCEAGFSMNGICYFYTKTHAKPYTGKSFQYKVMRHEEFQEIGRGDSAFFGDKGFIHNSLTGAAISSEADVVAFISCTHLWLRIFPERSAYINTGWLMDFEFEGFTQKEAVTFMNDREIVVGDERTAGIMGGRLYFYNLKAYFMGEKRYARPSVKNAVMRLGKERRTYDFAFESLEPLTEITIAWINEEGTMTDTQKIKLTDNRINEPIIYEGHGGETPVAYWLIAGDKILLTSKIIQP